MYLVSKSVICHSQWLELQIILMGLDINKYANPQNKQTNKNPTL